MDDSIPEWLEEALDFLDEMLANPKKVKFNTHKNRKEFCGKIRSVFCNGYKKDTNEQKSVRRPTITRPNPNGQSKHGFHILTEGDSVKADATMGRGPS